MIERYLGETIDIHGGGIDLVFPHHENERAQSVAAHHGSPLARFWMHNGFLRIESEKMSKSEGNVLLVNELLRQYQPEVIRYTMLSAHYRQPLDWSQATLHQSTKNLDRLYRILDETHDLTPMEGPPPEAFMEAIDDDLNTPRALAELNEIAKRAKSGASVDAQTTARGQLVAAGKLLGLLQVAPTTGLLTPDQGLSHELAAHVETQIQARAAARKNRDFAQADAIRNALEKEGIELEDSPSGTTWRKI
ncbi:MAG: class I tRNA ligase family protein [Myxococcales bacterium]|nr:class I tRNA ligase family protein [Myxococcales bacterium]